MQTHRELLGCFDTPVSPRFVVQPPALRVLDLAPLAL